MFPVNTVLEFTDTQYKKGNGKWRVMRVWNDGVCFLARLNDAGELLPCKPKNMLNLKDELIAMAIEVGTGKVVV